MAEATPSFDSDEVVYLVMKTTHGTRPDESYTRPICAFRTKEEAKKLAEEERKAHITTGVRSVDFHDK